MPSITGVLGVSFLTALFFKGLDFGLSWLLRKHTANNDVLVHTKKSFYTKRMEYIEKIFLILDKAYHAANTAQDQSDISHILKAISKSEIPRSLYFSEEENIAIEKIIDEIKSQSSQFINMANVDRLMVELKRCLGLNFVPQS